MHFIKIIPVLVLLFAFSAAPAFADSGLDGVQQNLMCQCGCTMVLISCECGTAEQLRGEIRTMLGQGQTQQQILDFYVGKYGEKVLSAPTKQGFNLTAYITPFATIFLAGGGILLLVRQWVLHSRKVEEVLPITESAAPSGEAVSVDDLRAQLARDLASYGE